MTNYNLLQVKMGVLTSSVFNLTILCNAKTTSFQYQRSADIFLGLPFNIASTSLLLSIVGKLTNYNVGTVTLNIGDCHIYKEHYDAVKTQLNRIPYDFPTINFPNFQTITDVENSKLEDYNLLDYQCHKSIKAKMIA